MHGTLPNAVPLQPPITATTSPPRFTITHPTAHTSPACHAPVPTPLLQGKSLGTTLMEALQPVPNPHGDAGITQLNRIRASLGHLAK